jgi:hypothetical protein
VELHLYFPIRLRGGQRDNFNSTALYILYLRIPCTVRSESRCALMLRYVDFVVSIEVAVVVQYQ